jgi:hypothetical protein
MWQRRFWNAFHYISHPVALRPANHPKYFLLGFSAALAPKFHPLCITYWLLARRAQESQGEPRRAQESPGKLRGAK